MKITNRFTDAIIFEAEVEDMKALVLKAISEGANLEGAKGVYQFGPMPTSGRLCVAVWHNDHWMVKAGCFWGTIDELEERVKEDHNCPVYLANIELLKNYKII
ncbi:MAG: hypothetical protein HC874_14170 [Richelia sp. SL_2_1]|nr:hypothetical protein [Richelia sp. SL_2_1]